MYTTDFAYDGPIFLVPLSPSYPSLPVVDFDTSFDKLVMNQRKNEIKKTKTVTRPNVYSNSKGL